MTQSSLSTQKTSRLHVAIIMDGNGRWARARGLPRVAGHRMGATAVRRIVEAAMELEIGTLTLYAFSVDNWQRPTREVALLMRLFRAYLHAETNACREHGIRIDVIGRRDRLPVALHNAIKMAESATIEGKRLCLRIAVDYSSRDAILNAARQLGHSEEKNGVSRETFSSLLTGAKGAAVPDVDLLIRTGGEQRLSDFLLWESAYAELYFTTCMWPDFGSADLAAAVREFQTRERRFGRVTEAAVG
ncbi:MAG: di-trans,poly-cis-decaprenylcistransferase [Acidobacteriota bacterium]